MAHMGERTGQRSRGSVKGFGAVGLVTGIIGLTFLGIDDGDRPKTVTPFRPSLFAATRLAEDTTGGFDPILPRVPAVSLPDPDVLSSVVPGLEEIRGIVRQGDDDFYLGERVLEIGPRDWLESSLAPSDVDGDNRVSTWHAELTGLTGRRISLLGDVDDDDIEVFEVNGVNLRPLYSTVAPWSEGWIVDASDLEAGARPRLDVVSAARIALGRVPGVIIAVQIDVNMGRSYWEFDVRGRDGYLWDVEIDATDGRVVEAESN